MDIYSYVDKYGKYTFEEEAFNEVDAILFSFLGYSNLEEILSKKDKKTIQEVMNEHIKKYPGRDKNILPTRESNRLFKYIKDVNRYKDCIISNYEYIGNDKIQFGAMTIEYQPNKVYVVLEGTDHYFSGWIDNFILSYKFPTLSHRLTVDYLNRHFTFSNDEIIIGGHSKGGNLALVGALKCNAIVRKKTKRVYNVDGPGLLDKEFNSKRYEKLKEKYIHYMPETSFVGLFLNHSNDYIVKTTSKSILSHLIYYWIIDETTFPETHLNSFSNELDKRLKDWFQKYNKEDKEAFIDNLNTVLKKANVNSILDLTTSITNIHKVIAESKEMDKQTKAVLKDFIGLLLRCFKNAKKEDIKGLVSHILRNKKQDEAK